MAHAPSMFLRRNRRTVNGEIYEYWTLVRTVRTTKGPRQEVVATLGKLPGLDNSARRGWEEVAALLDGRCGAPEQTPIRQAIVSISCGAAVDPSGCARPASGTGARLWADLFGSLSMAAAGIAHASGRTHRAWKGRSGLGMDRLHFDGGAVLRSEERVGSGRALVCRQRAGRFAGRALWPNQRRPASIGPGRVACAQRQTVHALAAALPGPLRSPFSSFFFTM